MRKDIFFSGLAVTALGLLNQDNRYRGSYIMLGSIKKFFSARRDYPGSSVAKDTPRATAPGTEIHYDPKLVDRFKGHHQELVKEILLVKKFLHAKNYAATAESLREFKTMLQQHLLEENLLFYTYLTHCLVDDTEGRELMAEMRTEMADIGRLVTRFIKHYLEFGINDSNAEKFDIELGNIISALGDRIKREESSLYTLYLPPNAISRR